MFAHVRDLGAMAPRLAPRWMLPARGYRAAGPFADVVSAGLVIGRAWSGSTTSAALVASTGRFSDVRGLALLAVVNRTSRSAAICRCAIVVRWPLPLVTSLGFEAVLRRETDRNLSVVQHES